MSRSKNSLEDNYKSIMDNNIKNIEPEMQKVLFEMVLSSNIENNKKIIEKFIRNQLNLPFSLSRCTKGYWQKRGWTDEESYIKSKEYVPRNRKSVYSRQTWLDRINPATGLNYTISEADFERNSRRINSCGILD